MKEKIKKYFGELLTIIGTGLFVSNFFKFSNLNDFSSSGSVLSLGGKYEGSGGVAYYYSEDVILWLTIGSILIATGFLIIRNRNIK